MKRAATSDEVWAVWGSSALEVTFSGEVSVARVSIAASVAEVERRQRRLSKSNATV